MNQNNIVTLDKEYFDYLIDSHQKLTRLITSVHSKYPNESRFETALRYINEREFSRSSGGVPQSVPGYVETYTTDAQDGC